MKLSLTDKTGHLQGAMAEDKAFPTKLELGLEDCRVSSRIFLRVDGSLGHQAAPCRGLVLQSGRVSTCPDGYLQLTELGS